jgi:hypothetical protein
MPRGQSQLNASDSHPWPGDQSRRIGRTRGARGKRAVDTDIVIRAQRGDKEAFVGYGVGRVQEARPSGTSKI